jgi:hypothetical protein
VFLISVFKVVGYFSSNQNPANTKNLTNIRNTVPTAVVGSKQAKMSNVTSKTSTSQRRAFIALSLDASMHAEEKERGLQGKRTGRGTCEASTG